MSMLRCCPTGNIQAPDSSRLVQPAVSLTPLPALAQRVALLPKEECGIGKGRRGGTLLGGSCGLVDGLGRQGWPEVIE